MDFPEQRVFRPKSEKENQIIAQLMKIHHLKGDIGQPSWTQYIAYLINKDLAEQSHMIKGKL